MIVTGDLSLSVACTDDILTDAKRKKQYWEGRLKDMEYQSLINTRDVLVAGICLHRMKAEDCSGNIEETKKDVSKKGLRYSNLLAILLYCLLWILI